VTVAGSSADRRGRLVVVSGPSGVGKGTVVRALRRRRPRLRVSVSATTRPRRPGEVDGRDYHFLDDDAFDRLVADGGLLEWAEFAGNRYGTPAAPVRAALEQGEEVLLEIEVQGACQVRRHQPEALLILLVPPSLDELGRRLRRRGTEDEAAVQRRLARARAELDEAGWFDVVVVNDEVARAAGEIDRILAKR
jgi:guanylate kinase